MMGSYAPPPQSGGLYDLLSVVADPKSTKKRLDEINEKLQTQQAHMAQLDEAQRIFNEKKKEEEAKRQAFEQVHREHEEEKARHFLEFQRRKEELEARERAVAELSSHNSLLEQELLRRKEEHDRRETFLQQRELHHNRWEEELKEREARANLVNSNYFNKIEQLKALIN